MLLPIAAHSGLVGVVSCFCHTAEPGRASPRWAGVCGVLGPCRRTYVAPAVVGSIAVFVVEKSRRFFARDDHPSETVSAVFFALSSDFTADSDNDVALVVWSPSHRAGADTRLGFPAQLPGFLVVREQRFCDFWRHLHDI